MRTEINKSDRVVRRHCGQHGNAAAAAASADKRPEYTGLSTKRKQVPTYR